MRKTIQRISDFLIYSNLFVALAVACFTWETLLLYLEDKIDYRYLSLVFLSTLFLYNFHRWYGLNKRKNEELSARYVWIKKQSVLFYFIFIASGAALLFQAFSLGKEVFFYFSLLGIIALGYTVPFFKTSKGWFRLRDVPGMKVFLIITVCAIVSTVLPFVYHQEPEFLYKQEFWLYFANRLLFLLAITLPFDMRDREYDKAKGLKTIPVLLGQGRTKQICYVAFILSFVPIFFTGDLIFLMINVVVSVLGILAVYNIDSSKPESYYSFFLEGLMVLRLVLLAM